MIFFNSMPVSKAHKYINKLMGWTRHVGSIQAEKPKALEEFFINPGKIPEDYRSLATGLFADWFLFDRKLTFCNLTPLELFIQSQEKKLKTKEVSIYEAFLGNNVFGFFKVEDFKYEEWIELRLMPDGDCYRVFEEEGSCQAEEGDYLIARLFPFEDHWAMSSFVAAMPEQVSYLLDRDFKSQSGRFKPDELRPRHVLSFFMPKIRWEEEGLARIRAKLAAVLDRWGVRDMEVSQIEKEICLAHEKSQDPPALFLEVLEKAPSTHEAQEVNELLAALWNLNIEKYRPIDPGIIKKGPMERMLLADLAQRVAGKWDEEDEDDPEGMSELADEMFKEWVDAPQEELEDKTPREVILQERRSLGNSQEEIGYKLTPTIIAGVESKEKKAIDLAMKGRSFLLQSQSEKAIECYSQAYPVLKYHPNVFRLLGNMAVAYLMSGEREKALEMLRAALKSNPDYTIARNNLHRIESMSPEEFKRRRQEGFFRLMELVGDEQD